MGYEPVQRIRPVAPTPSILTSARSLPDGTNWSTGISWSPMVQPSYTWQWCPGVDPERKKLPNDRERAYSSPFVIYTPALCDLPVDGADLATMVEELTEVHTANEIARQVWMADSGTFPEYDPDHPQVSLRRNATLVPGTYDLDDGVAVLLASFSSCTGGNGGATIHVPETLIEAALGGSNNGSRVCWPEGNIYRAALSAVISPGPGYPIGSSADGPDGFGPKTTTDPAAEEFLGNDVDEAWIYVSGPVEYAVGQVVTRPETEADRMAFRQNTYEAWAERSAIFRFDPTCVFAVLVNNPAPIEEAS